MSLNKKSVYWRCVCMCSFSMLPQLAVHVLAFPCSSILYPSRFIYIRQPFPTIILPRGSIHMYKRVYWRCACAHFPCFRNWLCMSADIHCRVSVLDVGAHLLPNGNLRFGGSTWCISSDLHCRANLQEPHLQQRALL